MYKKQYASLIGGYWLEPVEDYEYWLRLTEHCEIQYIPIELMDYRENSTHSVSASLKSRDQHRKWRHAFNLARQQARGRRKIRFETTIIFPVQDGSEQTIVKLERLLDQFYSHYKLILIDISPNAAVLPALREIQDPRIKRMRLPGYSEIEAVKVGMRRSDTHYTLLYGKGHLPEMSEAIFNLVLRLRQFKPSHPAISTFYKPGSKRVSTKKIRSAVEPCFGELYRTEKLLEIFNQNSI